MSEGRDPAPGSDQQLFRKRFGAKARDPASVTDAMQRDEPPGPWYWFWEYDVLDGLFWGAPVALVTFAIVLAQGDYGFATLMPTLWLGWVLVLAPIVVWGVLLRQKPGDISVTVAALAIGAAPGVLFLPGLSTSEMPAVMATFPLLVIWGAASHVLALNQGLVARLPAGRPIILVGGGLLYALLAACLFAAIAAGWLGGVWALVCGGLGLGFAFIGVKLWLAANSPNR